MEFIYVLAVLLCIHQMVETRSLEDNLLYKNTNVPKNWKNDKKYTFNWTGDFTYNIAEDSFCERVIIPTNGRFICSSGKGLNRVMCLTECIKGYEHADKAMVFICKKTGEWLNIFQKVVPTPHPKCVKSKWSAEY